MIMTLMGSFVGRKMGRVVVCVYMRCGRRCESYYRAAWEGYDLAVDLVWDLLPLGAAAQRESLIIVPWPL